MRMNDGLQKNVDKIGKDEIFKLINGFTCIKDTKDNRIDLGLGIMSSLNLGKRCINAKYLFVQRQ